MKLLESVKTYFEKKRNNESTGTAPEGVCPNCWGKQEWEGHFYKEMKAKNISPQTDTYNNFIKDVVTKHIEGIRIDQTTYTCVTCNVKY